jgi:starvation-inducible DNA-binding protein
MRTSEPKSTRDVATQSLLEIFIDEGEKRCWFLFETSRGPDPSGH